MIAGTVAQVTKKDWKNGIFMYHFQLTGSPRVHNCGTTDPEVKEGECITFTEANRKVNVSSIKRVSEEEAARVDSQAPAGRTPSARSVTQNSEAVGVRIQKQQARRDAIRLVTVAMENKLLPYPQSGKNEDKWNRLLDLINETTNDLIEMEDTWNERSPS
jgi:hypothetical protein